MLLDDGLHIIELYGLMDGKELLTKRCYLQMDQNSMSPPVLRDTEIERERESNVVIPGAQCGRCRFNCNLIVGNLRILLLYLSG